jgi:hypothetical protein
MLAIKEYIGYFEENEEAIKAACKTKKGGKKGSKKGGKGGKKR